MVTFMHAGFRVDDFDVWKKGFDGSATQRKMAGEVRIRCCVTRKIRTA